MLNYIGIFPLLLLLTFSLNVHNYKFRTSRPINTYLKSGLRLLIQGTKNAYTTLMPWDVVLYQIPETDTGERKSIGYLTTDNSIQPLGVLEEGDAEYHPNIAIKPIPAQKMIDAKQLLRIVSSDRSKGIFTIDEYLGSDVYIPIIEKKQDDPSPSLSSASATNKESSSEPTAANTNNSSISQSTTTSTNTLTLTDNNHPIQPINRSNDNDNDRIDNIFQNDIDVLQAELKVARLELQLLKVQKLTTLKSNGSSNGNYDSSKSESDILTRHSNNSNNDNNNNNNNNNNNDNNNGTNNPLEVNLITSISPTLSTSIKERSDNIDTTTTTSITSSSSSTIIMNTKPSYHKLSISNGYIYLSGCNGIDSETKTLSSDLADDFMQSIQMTYSIETEIREAFKNVISHLYTYHSHPAYITSITIHMHDMKVIPLIHKIYLQMFPMDPNTKVKPPALRFLESPIPLLYEANIEIDVVAIVKFS